MTTNGEPAQTMDDLAREWSAKIEYLLASVNKANTEQKSKYLEYISSLQARQENLQGILHKLHSPIDFAQ